jgi:hypothetical protein
MRQLTAKTTRRRIALFVASFGLLLSTALSFGTVASGRVKAGEVAQTAPASYSGGILSAADPLGGYWTTTWLGTITSHGGAPTFGSPALSGVHLTQPIIGMAATPDGQGYWLVASDGGIFAYGDAQFFGSTGAMHLNEPIVGMAATPDGQGYWLVASDGGIFTYGDAQFFGSTGAMHLNQPIVGMAATPGGQGYWLVASDGGIFTFGDAQFYGSTGALHLNEPIIGMAATPDGKGYWLVASDGGIFTYGDAQFAGSLGASDERVMGIIINPLSTGYTLIETDGGALAMTSPAAGGNQSPSTTTTTTTSPGTGLTTTQPSPDEAQLADDCKPATIPTASVDSSLDSLIANQTGPGWVGGDATYSTQLPDGDEAFVFSDTLIGSAQPSGVAQLTAFTHNSELVGAMPDLEGNFGGTTSAPQTLIPDTTDAGDQWQVSATYVENDDQLVFVNEFAPLPGNSSIDQFTGHSGIAVFSLQGDGMPVFDSVTPLPTDANTQWGTAVTQSGGYTYVFGSDTDPTNGQQFYGMKVARVVSGSSLITDAWQYWNGAQWVSGEQNALPIATTAVLNGVTTQQGGSGYVAVSIPVSFWDDTNVDLSYACSPAGPWSTPVPVYTIPQVSQFPDEIAYIPTFHPELSGSGLVISYNINSLDGLNALEQNIHLYQPQFLELNNS